MANLNETDVWEGGIYQLEEDDPVLGGPTGIDNMAPRQLASRSRFQRLRNITPWDAALSYPANVAYVSYAGVTWKSVGESTNVAPGSDTAKWVRWGFTEAELSTALGDAVALHEAKPDPHTQYVWVGGDTMTGPLSVPAGAVGTQVPRVQEVVKKAGDTMTGPLLLPDVGQFDASTKAASTAHIQRALGSFSGSRDIAASGNLSVADIGRYITVSGANVSLALPEGGQVVAGAAFVVGPALRCVITRSGLDGIATPAGTVVTSMALFSPSIIVWRGDLWHVLELPMSGDADTGTVFFTARATPPPGSVKANAAALSRTTYSRLFAAIGTTYGAGDGVNTFNVPDGRAVFFRGLDDGRGIDSARVLGSFQEGTWLRTVAQEWSGGDGADSSKVHLGNGYAQEDARITNSNVGGAVPSGAKNPAGGNYNTATTDNTVNGEQVVDSVASLNNWIRMRPSNLALLACIKY